MGTDVEILVVGNCYLKKEEWDNKLKLDYTNFLSWIELDHFVWRVTYGYYLYVSFDTKV
jgi:hypothetical protein